MTKSPGSDQQIAYRSGLYIGFRITCKLYLEATLMFFAAPVCGHSRLPAIPVSLVFKTTGKQGFLRQM
ncbi:MAG: hypothetical protein CMJ47_07150 [Planctomyces sp.]|nr:hypothetical protein [Planctomyces sp.]